VTRLCRCEASRRSRDDRCEMCDDAVLAVKLLATLEVLRSELDFFCGALSRIATAIMLQKPMYARHQ
jgi:hypothetical protein